MPSKTLSLSVKLFASFGLVAFIGIAAVLILFIQLNEIDTDIDKLKTSSVDRIDALSSVHIGMLSARVAHELWKQPSIAPAIYAEQFDELHSSLEKAGNALNSYAQIERSREEEGIFARMKENVSALFGFYRQIAGQAREYQGRPDAAGIIAALCEASNRAKMIAVVMEDLYELRRYVDQRGQEIIDHAHESADAAYIIGIVAIFFVLFVGFGFGAILTQSITKNVKTIAKVILRDAGTIVKGAKELATGSQALAAASSEQAASVEEISAALEEVASMIRQNADNTAEADRLTTETSKGVDHTERLMNRSLAASEEISRVSNETFKIIKSVDEIAFQTNLLSLNAAVEAARAGDAGAGFAVVADEVRGLSMRSAEAAKRTAELIEQTITKVREGMDIFTETGKSIEIVVGKTHKIRELIAMVTTASSEQAKGVDQISKGVLEMEKVIQQNAANSEESAASTEEMFSQAAEMSEAVNAFAHYIYGGDKRIEKELGSHSAVYYD
jgi:methyl-accepting chemotaxis protein